MDGIVRAAAAYRNAGNAIGYSFRFFVTTMAGAEGIKLLKIDGVAPTVETIRGGTYPYTGNLYAVTTNKTADNPHVQELIAWFLSPQGQRLIEDAGYVSLGGK
jgi:phosphate transport system substrate-binding protein